MTYADKLKDPRWQKKRLIILDRDKWTCKKCGNTKVTLNVHHLKYNKNPWESLNKDLITICEHCHQVISNLTKGIGNINFKEIKIAHIYVPNNLLDRVDIYSNKGSCWIDRYKNGEMVDRFGIDQNALPSLSRIINHAHKYKCTENG